MLNFVLSKIITKFSIKPLLKKWFLLHKKLMHIVTYNHKSEHLFAKKSNRVWRRALLSRLTCGYHFRQGRFRHNHATRHKSCQFDHSVSTNGSKPPSEMSSSSAEAELKTGRRQQKQDRKWTRPVQQTALSSCVLFKSIIMFCDRKAVLHKTYVRFEWLQLIYH